MIVRCVKKIICLVSRVAIFIRKLYHFLRKRMLEVIEIKGIIELQNILHFLFHLIDNK